MGACFLHSIGVGRHDRVDWTVSAIWRAGGALRQSIIAGLIVTTHAASAVAATHEVLAFYYGWWGTPAVTGGWRHWQNVELAAEHIDNSAHYPAGGPYDSHDQALLDRQVTEARAAGVTGFIASWWGPGSFEDRGIAPLLAAAGRHGLSVSAYYEKLAGDDGPDRIKNAVADLDYLLSHYASDKAWLRADGKPVVFIYGRALKALSAPEWQQVTEQVRRDYPGGVALIADSFDHSLLIPFDGASTYNITGQTQRKSPPQLRDWAHAAFPKMVAAAGPGNISTVTVIPGYDDRAVGRPPPRPVTERWGGETYRALWQEAIAASPDWVLITSWNEWHEGSEIEPSVEYGSLLLDETRDFAKQFLASRK
jgi:glycoprotein endo-alpha-1,2-mannosidase